jgi:hypothetical protein
LARIDALTAYIAADWLIKVIIKKSIAQLLTLLRLIIFLTALENITINLAFVTKKIANKL